MLCSHPVHRRHLRQKILGLSMIWSNSIDCIELCVPAYIAHTQHYIPCDEVIAMHVELLVCILAAAIVAIGCRV